MHCKLLWLLLSLLVVVVIFWSLSGLQQDVLISLSLWCVMNTDRSSSSSSQEVSYLVRCYYRICVVLICLREIRNSSDTEADRMNLNTFYMKRNILMFVFNADFTRKHQWLTMCRSSFTKCVKFLQMWRLFKSRDFFKGVWWYQQPDRCAVG